MKEYYNMPEELFDNGDTKETLLDGYLNPMLEDKTIKAEIKAGLLCIKDSETLQDELIDIIKNNLNDSDTLNNYITDYDVNELGNMDGPWNTVIDITYDTIEDFIKNRLEESGWAKEFKDYENLWEATDASSK